MSNKLLPTAGVGLLRRGLLPRRITKYATISLVWKTLLNHSLNILLHGKRQELHHLYKHELTDTPKQFNSASRLTALRFKKRAILPVQGWTNIIIPISILDAIPTVAGKELRVGSYMYLMKDVAVEPGFYCLLLKPQ